LENFLVVIFLSFQYRALQKSSFCSLTPLIFSFKINALNAG
jgi:hypothetical protein